MGDRISRGAGRVEDQMNSDRDTDLKGSSVTHLIMGVRRKDKNDGSKSLEGLESCMFGGSPNFLQL